MCDNSLCWVVFSFCWDIPIMFNQNATTINNAVISYYIHFQTPNVITWINENLLTPWCFCSVDFQFFCFYPFPYTRFSMTIVEISIWKTKSNSSGTTFKVWIPELCTLDLYFKRCQHLELNICCISNVQSFFAHLLKIVIGLHTCKMGQSLKIQQTIRHRSPVCLNFELWHKRNKNPYDFGFWTNANKVKIHEERSFRVWLQLFLPPFVI